MNQNHSHYNLSSGPNLNLLDNMLMAAGFQATEQPVHKQMIPQYTSAYHQDLSLHGHNNASAAMNLAAVPSHATTTSSTEPIHVIVYNEQQGSVAITGQHHVSGAVPLSAQRTPQQQQPISYKIPHLGPEDSVAVVTQSQSMGMVVNELSGGIAAAAATTAESLSMDGGKKDIVAEAMRTEKIFDEPKTNPINIETISLVKQEAFEPMRQNDRKPLLDTKPTPKINIPQPKVVPSKRGGTMMRGYNRQQIMPRLQILDDEDDGLTCRMCLQSFWYKHALMDHLKEMHSISEPEKYEREEREKKLRRIREEQQRILVARRAKEMRLRGGLGGISSPGIMSSRGGRGNGLANNNNSLGRLNGQSKPTASQRPSFQYRDGAFICDLCKESFSDGNDMVSHWKKHVRRQKDSVPVVRGRGRGRGTRGRGNSLVTTSAALEGLGRGITVTRGRGRLSRSMDNNEQERPARGRGSRGRRGCGGRSRGRGRGRGKGMARWNSYLLWSVRRRKEMMSKDGDLTFAEVAKNISDEWKLVDAESRAKYQEEANKLNESGIRKLPKINKVSDDEDDTSEEDPSFEEPSTARKPIMLKIKKVDVETEADSDNVRKKSKRQQKRPSFFQDFENVENNLDKILDDFEQEQMQESRKPKIKKELLKTVVGSRRKKRAIKTPPPEESIAELETTRSGRVRKKTKFFDYFDASDEPENIVKQKLGKAKDDTEFEPESEPEEPEEEFMEDECAAEEEEEEILLPPKKRGRSKKLMTDAEIEEATRTATLSAKPIVMLNNMANLDDDEEDEDEDPHSDSNPLGEVTLNPTSPSSKSNQLSSIKPTFKVKPTWIQDEEDEDESRDEDGDDFSHSVKQPPSYLSNNSLTTQNNLTSLDDTDNECTSNSNSGSQKTRLDPMEETWMATTPPPVQEVTLNDTPELILGNSAAPVNDYNATISTQPNPLSSSICEDVQVLKSENNDDTSESLALANDNVDDRLSTPAICQNDDKYKELLAESSNQIDIFN